MVGETRSFNPEEEVAESDTEAENITEIANIFGQKEGDEKIEAIDVLHAEALELNERWDELNEIQMQGFGEPGKTKTKIVEEIKEFFDKYPELTADKIFVKRALRGGSGTVLEKASPELRTDKDVVLEAVISNPDALEYASDELKSDKDFILKAISERTWDCGPLIKYASPELQADKEVVLEAAKKPYFSLEDAGEFNNDKEIVLEVVKKDGMELKHASDKLSDDEEVVLAAVKNEGSALQFASDRLKANTDVVLTAVKSRRESLEYASPELKERIENILQR